MRVQRGERVQRVPGEIAARLDPRQTLIVVSRALACLGLRESRGRPRRRLVASHHGGHRDDPATGWFLSSSCLRFAITSGHVRCRISTTILPVREKIAGSLPPAASLVGRVLR